MFDYPELVRVLDPSAETREGLSGNGALRGLVNAAALLTHEKGMVARELFPQLVPEALARGVHHSEDSRRRQQVNVPINGDAVDVL